MKDITRCCVFLFSWWRIKFRLPLLYSTVQSCCVVQVVHVVHISFVCIHVGNVIFQRGAVQCVWCVHVYRWAGMHRLCAEFSMSVSDISTSEGAVPKMPGVPCTSSVCVAS